ncbi:MAG: flagellar basal body L-ring protein FlgH [Betaproteobacteria bacterium]
MKKTMMRMLTMLVCMLLPACAINQRPIVHQPMTARPLAQPAVPVHADGSIYQQGNFRPLFEDRRARFVGDTLTIFISEKTAANKKSGASAERTSAVSAAVPVVQGLPGKSLQGLALEASTSNKFDGKGQAAASNNFTGVITVTVIEVLTNGNLLVSGEKQIAMSQGSEFIRFSGIVNPVTVTPDNAVVSTNVADARIEYRANGYIDEAQTMGWLARFFNNVMPF